MSRGSYTRHYNVVCGRLNSVVINIAVISLDIYVEVDTETVALVSILII
jgi:hypothetical protein